MALDAPLANGTGGDGTAKVPVLDMNKLKEGDAVFGELERMLGGLGEWLDVMQVGLEEVDFGWDEGIDEGHGERQDELAIGPVPA